MIKNTSVNQAILGPSSCSVNSYTVYYTDNLFVSHGFTKYFLNRDKNNNSVFAWISSKGEAQGKTSIQEGFFLGNDYGRLGKSQLEQT